MSENSESKKEKENEKHFCAIRLFVFLFDILGV